MNNNQSHLPIERVEQDDIVYSLNKEMIANVIGCNSKNQEIIIPYSIIVESNEYIVTSISEGSFNNSKIRSIKFASNSEVQVIEKEAFVDSKIEHIMIPPKLVELKEGWCKNMAYLTDININPNNPHFQIYKNELIIGKSSNYKDNYDCLVFCFRGAETIKIPSFIEHICPYSFQYCEYLLKINFSRDSKLKTIGKYAFSNSSIVSITIPPFVTLIDECAFYDSELKKIEFSDDSNLQIIGKSAFCDSSIKSITIPSNITQIYECAFESCRKLRQINFHPDIKLETINTKLFLFSSIESICIPSSVIHIKEEAFSYCEKLKQITFQNNSKLQIIDKNSFSYSAIDNIEIPSELKIIKEGAFKYCNQLKHINFPNNSKLQMLENYAFFFANIESITIPSHLINLNDGQLGYTLYLTKIDISPDNPYYKIYEDKFIIGKSMVEAENFDNLVFAVKNIKKATIPYFIKHICSCAFQFCTKLSTIDITHNSMLHTIDNDAFSYSAIKSISIPSQVTRIGEDAFFGCSLLQIIEFDNNADMDSFCKYLFSLNKFAIIMKSVNLKT